MDEKKLLEVLGNIEEALIAEAAPRKEYQRKFSKKMWIKWGGLAACILLVAGVSIPRIVAVYKNEEKQQEIEYAEKEETETINVNNTTTTLIVSGRSKGTSEMDTSVSKDNSKDNSKEEDCTPFFSPEPARTIGLTDEGFPDWGLSLMARDVTASGLTLVCTQSEGNLSGTLQTGSEYRLIVLEHGTWNNVPTVLEEYGWDSIAYLIEKEGFM